jgi:hypothetical protein
MLTSCAPFTRLYEVASKHGSVEVWSVIRDTTGKEVIISIVGRDTQLVTDWEGRSYRIAGTNISQIVENYGRLFPALVPAEVVIHVKTPKGDRSERVGLIPMNPELIATTAKRLLRRSNG